MRRRRFATGGGAHIRCMPPSYWDPFHGQCMLPWTPPGWDDNIRGGAGGRRRRATHRSWSRPFHSGGGIRPHSHIRRRPRPIPGGPGMPPPSTPSPIYGSGGPVCDGPSHGIDEFGNNIC